MSEDYFKKLELTLNNFETPINMWWRDDDVRAKCIPFYKYKEQIEYRRYKQKLQTILELLNKYQIPPIFAVIPENYLEKGQSLTELLKANKAFVMLHGLKHVRNMLVGLPPSEFPDYRQEDYLKIMEFYKSFKQIFGEQLLNAFCPPYNNINEVLAEKLNEAGLIISSSNESQEISSIYNVDYDFCDWTIHKPKAKEKIVNELCALLKSGRKSIGINSHHLRLSAEDGDFAFFDRIFSIISKSEKVHWINPFV
ncbi:MAG: polysaccharide deacetylase family protein [Alphaproteobacteria bacterium]|nr:polysaccharide deacetylase family protein [Alphaproteobacteria bacterium]